MLLRSIHAIKRISDYSFILFVSIFHDINPSKFSHPFTRWCLWMIMKKGCILKNQTKFWRVLLLFWTQLCSGFIPASRIISWLCLEAVWGGGNWSLVGCRQGKLPSLVLSNKILYGHFSSSLWKYLRKQVAEFYSEHMFNFLGNCQIMSYKICGEDIWMVEYVPSITYHEE